jgi:hypothetical protein
LCERVIRDRRARRIGAVNERRGIVRLTRDAAVAMACLALGFGSVLLWRAVRDRDTGTAAVDSNPRIALDDLTRDRATGSPAMPTDAAAVEQPAAPAPSPVAAVERFLAAESARDYDASFGMLSAAERRELGSGAEWTAAHGQLPEVLGFVLEAAGPGLDRVEVESSVELRPVLDDTIGLVPARARATWVAVAEDGGWRVAFEERRFEPRYPPDADAVATVRAWARDRRECTARAAGELRGGLLGVVDLAAALCGGRSAAVGTPGPLDPDNGIEPFLAAYGPDVFSWARVVPVSGPVALGAVVAPVGHRWRVIGVIESSPGGSP